MPPFLAALIARLSVGKFDWQNMLVKAVDIVTRPPLNERLDQIGEIVVGQQITHESIAKFENAVENLSQIHEERRQNIAELRANLETIIENQEKILTRLAEIYLIDGPQSPQDD